MDSRYIKYSKLAPSFTKGRVDGKYKDILINPFHNYLIKTINGEPKSIILQSKKDKNILKKEDIEKLKTLYFYYLLEKNKVVLLRRLKAVMFVMNPNIYEKDTVGHLDRNR
jgi:hypothetical protein